MTVIDADDPLSAAYRYLASGDASGAVRVLESVSLQQPQRGAYLHLLALASAHLGRYEAALPLFRRLAAEDPANADASLQHATCLLAISHRDEARLILTRVRALSDPRSGVHARLGATLIDAGDFDRALCALRAAIAISPDETDPWAHLARLAGLQCDSAATLRAFHRMAALDDASPAHEALAMQLLHDGAIDAACRLLDASACRTRASAWYCPQLADRAGPATGRDSFSITTAAKLEHDAQQFEYLLQRGWLPAHFSQVAADYRRLAAETFDPKRAEPCFGLSPEQQQRIAATYNRFVYRSPAGQYTGPILNPSVDWVEHAGRYAAGEIVVIDDFLVPAALDAIYRYCLESTIWFDDRHLAGYLGALLRDGLASPVLLALAAELPRAMPETFRGHKLREMWAYKYETRFQGIALHADAAVVNVNFWITPNSANLMPGRGGLIVFDKAAPGEWDFRKYNNDQPAIIDFLKHSNARPIGVPYRQNRCVIFDSDLFHRTDDFEFRDDYPSRRVNVTLLYGDRGHRTDPRR